MRTVRYVWPKGQKYPRLIEETAGFAINGIRRISLTMDVGEFPVVDAEIFVHKDDIDIESVTALAKFSMKHPVDGDLREIKSVTFADGTTVDL